MPKWEKCYCTQNKNILIESQYLKDEVIIILVGAHLLQENNIIRLSSATHPLQSSFRVELQDSVITHNIHVHKPTLLSTKGTHTQA